MSNEHNNAPAVPQGEPVAWMVTNGGPHSLYFSRMYADDAVWMAKNVCYKKSIPNDFQIHPLYATPAPSPAQERCHLCDCTGDIHDATGEWRDECPYCKPEQEVTQSEPIYQLQRGDGSWIDQDKASYDYNAQYGINTIRIVYTAPAPAQEAMQSFTVPDDLPGMWEHSDLTGGETDCAAPAQEVGLTLSAEDVHAAFTKNFPKSRISQAWINFAADIAQAIAARAAKPAQEVGLTDEEIDAIASEYMSTVGDHWCNEEAIRERHAEDFARAIIAALRAKGAL